MNDNDNKLREIIRGCSRNDSKLQEKLYKHFFGYALSIALRYCQQRDDALDVVNDGFIKVFSGISGYDTSYPFKPWLRKIIVNTALDRARKRKDFLFAEDQDSLQVPDENVNVPENLGAGDVLTLLNRLPKMHRIVFMLYETEGYSHNEISDKLGISASSSRVYLARAKSKLRELFPLYF